MAPDLGLYIRTVPRLLDPIPYIVRAYTHIATIYACSSSSKPQSFVPRDSSLAYTCSGQTSNQNRILAEDRKLYKMTRSKRTSHTRHSTPARCIPRIHAHSSPTRNKFRYQRHPNLKRKHSAISHRPGNNPEDTYLSLLRSIQETENDDDASSDGTNSDASSEDQLEGWDEETTLVEMLGCPYSNPFLSVTR
jgi:hypothetical protein